MKLKIGKEKSNKQPLPMIGGDTKSSKSSPQSEPTNKTDSAKSKNKSFFKKPVLLGLLLLVIAGASGYFLYDEYYSTDNQEAKEIVKDPVKVQQEIIAIDAAAFNGDVDGAYIEIDKLISAQSDPVEKSYLLIDKSVLAENYGSKDDALKAANQAYELNQDLSTISRLAQVYEQIGDKEQAIKFYKESLVLVQDADFPGSSIDKNTFETKINDLEAVQ